MKHLKTFENFNSSTNEELLSNIFGKKLSKDDVLKMINEHPNKKKLYDSMIKDGEKEKAEKYIQFFIKNPKTKYCSWDPKKKEWIETGKFAVAGHTFGSGT